MSWEYLNSPSNEAWSTLSFIADCNDSLGYWAEWDNGNDDDDDDDWDDDGWDDEEEDCAKPKKLRI